MQLNTSSIPAPDPEREDYPTSTSFPWSNTNPYIVFNLRSPDAGGAMAKLKVRQAMAWTVNKSAIQKLFGGPAVAQISNTAIPAGNDGYKPFTGFSTPGNQGDLSKCKSRWPRPGYPHGLTLIDEYINDSLNTALFQSVQASAANCGIKLTGKATPISSYFVNLGNAPQNNKANQWDVAQAAWIPDWFGDNGRTTVQPFFQTNCTLNTVNYGCYDNSTVNSLITSAEGASSTSAAGNYWHQADMQIMSDAAIVPIMNQGFPQYTSARVRGIASNGQTYPTAIFQPEHRRAGHHRRLAGRRLNSKPGTSRVTSPPGAALRRPHRARTRSRKRCHVDGALRVAATGWESRLARASIRDRLSGHIATIGCGVSRRDVRPGDAGRRLGSVGSRSRAPAALRGVSLVNPSLPRSSAVGAGAVGGTAVRLHGGWSGLVGRHAGSRPTERPVLHRTYETIPSAYDPVAEPLMGAYS